MLFSILNKTEHSTDLTLVCCIHRLRSILLKVRILRWCHLMIKCSHPGSLGSTILEIFDFAIIQNILVSQEYRKIRMIIMNCSVEPFLLVSSLEIFDFFENFRNILYRVWPSCMFFRLFVFFRNVNCVWYRFCQGYRYQ